MKESDLYRDILIDPTKQYSVDVKVGKQNLPFNFFLDEEERVFIGTKQGVIGVVALDDIRLFMGVETMGELQTKFSGKKIDVNLLIAMINSSAEDYHVRLD